VNDHPNPSLKIEACARAAHEVNRAYCLALGDVSQPPWEEAPEWQRSSARNGVAGALAGNTPEQSHEGWLAEKAAAGWKYGPVKDPNKKEHPCFTSYARLPPEQRKKDDLFLSTVRSVAAALGMKITYPATAARPAEGPLPAVPAFPEHTVDFSKDA
jgi:hypothetical protein